MNELPRRIKPSQQSMQRMQIETVMTHLVMFLCPMDASRPGCRTHVGHLINAFVQDINVLGVVTRTVFVNYWALLLLLLLW